VHSVNLDKILNGLKTLTPREHPGPWIASEFARGGTRFPPGGDKRAPMLQGLDDLAAVVIRQPDVEQHMDVIRCRIDVGHHRVDRGVGVRQKARGVATHGIEPAIEWPSKKATSVKRTRLSSCVLPSDKIVQPKVSERL
jgi:hypothetical protein